MERVITKRGITEVNNTNLGVYVDRGTNFQDPATQLKSSRETNSIFTTRGRVMLPGELPKNPREVSIPDTLSDSLQRFLYPSPFLDPLRAAIQYSVDHELWQPPRVDAPQTKVEPPELIEGSILDDVLDVSSSVVEKGRDLKGRIRERIASVKDKGKELFSHRRDEEKKITRGRFFRRSLVAGTALAGIAVGAGMAAPEQTSGSEELKAHSAISSELVPGQIADNPVQKRWDPDYLPLTKRVFVAKLDKEASTPPVLKAELKPKPKQEPRSQENKDTSVSRGASASLSGDFPSGLSNIQRIVYEVAKSCNNEDQWDAIKNIVYHESYPKWDPASLNTTSGAGGLFQALPTSKYGVGDSWPTNPRAQAEWGVCVYMNKKDNPQGRYWDPNEAWRFWQANNWY